MKVDFFVSGIPRPGGSKSGYAIRTGKYQVKKGKPQEIIKVAMVDAGGKKTKDWRWSVIEECKKVFNQDPLQGPLHMQILFYMPFRKADFDKKGSLRGNAPIWCETKPDGLKLRRSVEDALKGILYKDDSQIVDGHEIKLYGIRTGARIIVEHILESAPGKGLILP